MSQHRASVRLVALVADRDIEESLAKLFGRPEHLGIRPFRFAITRHPDRDAGCRAHAANFLRQFLRSYRHALVVFDRDGCGSPSTREEIERTVERDLSRNGWERRAHAVVTAVKTLPSKSLRLHCGSGSRRLGDNEGPTRFTPVRLTEFGHAPDPRATRQDIDLQTDGRR